MSCIPVFLFLTISSCTAYKAAFLEYLPTVHYDGRPTKAANLNVFEQFANKASLEGAQIIVFPEYGITGYSDDGALSWQQTRFSESIPEASGDIPCDRPHKYAQAVSIIRLSCMAKNHSIAIVANLMDFQTYRIFNTDVAFDTDGTFLLKYHKLNRWGESMISIDPTCSPAHFTTSFNVTFGVFTCADIIWEHPAEDLIKKGIVNFAAPMSWDNSYAQLQALAYAQGWSAAHGVNLIICNNHWGTNGSVGESGSGIWVAGEPLTTYYHPDNTQVATLRIASIPQSELTSTASELLSGRARSGPVKATVRFPLANPTSKQRTNWKFVNLSQQKVCTGTFCCQVTALNGNATGYVLALLDGIDYGPPGVAGQWPAQACGVLPCTSPGEGCLKFQDPTGIIQAITLKMTGKGHEKNVAIPEVLASDGAGTNTEYVLLPGEGAADTYHLVDNRSSTSASLTANTTKKTLLSVLLYVRRFDLDGPRLPYHCTSESESAMQSLDQALAFAVQALI